MLQPVVRGGHLLQSVLRIFWFIQLMVQVLGSEQQGALPLVVRALLLRCLLELVVGPLFIGGSMQPVVQARCSVLAVIL